MPEPKTEMKELSDTFEKTIVKFREENDKLIKDNNALNEEKVKSIQDQLDKVELKYKELETAIKVEEKKDDLACEFKEEYEIYMQKGPEHFTPEQSKTFHEKAKLIAGDSTQGGYLVLPQFELDIIKKVTEISPIEQFARVIVGGMRSYIFASRKTLLSAFFVGEQGLVNKDASTYEQGEIQTHAMAVNVPISSELLQDSFKNMEQEIQTDVTTAFAQRKGKAFVKGLNVNEPEGFITNADTEVIETETSLKIDPNDLYNIVFALKTEYAVSGSQWFGNRLTLRDFRKLKDAEGRYILQTAQDSTITYELLGYPYAEVPDMDVGTTTAGKKVVSFGNMFQHYRVYNRTGMSVLRDPFTAKNKRMVEFQFEMRTGGKVVLPEAMKILKIKA